MVEFKEYVIYIFKENKIKLELFNLDENRNNAKSTGTTAIGNFSR